MTRLIGLSLLFAAAALPAVRSVEVTARTPVNKGYERISGRVHFGANPALAANRIVRDLDLAPVNASGDVEYTADFVLIRPRDPARSNGTVLFEVSNRGGKGMLSRFDFAKGGEDFGDESVLDQGYTLAWLGWEWDVAPTAGLHFTPPHFRPDAPSNGLVRSEFSTDHAVTSMRVTNQAAELPIAVGKPLALYVRDSPERDPRKIAADRWKLGADGKSVDMPGGFELGLLYEFVYEGKDPVVAGTGLAAIRDWISYLKYGGADTALGDQRAVSKRALGFGISQSGRFLRTFLYDGFNADESGRRVFDGVWADVAGAGRGSFNFRYAQASRDGHPYLNIFYPTDVFPFVDTALLERARAAKAAPKLFLTNNSYEYWGRAAALVHVTPDGKGDAPISPDTRIYFTAGVAHGPGSLPLNKTGGARYFRDPVDHRPVQRALLAAMQAWLKDGTAPPASMYPRLSEHQLTPLAALRFPAIDGVEMPKHPRAARRLDFGPDFETKGIVTQEPPKVNGAYPVLVPQVDADGIDLAGIRLPEVAEPVGTITGWNLRAPGRGAPEEISEFNGSFFPFAKTKQERGKDSRPAVSERYANRVAYLERAGAAADRLIAGRYLLAQDRAYVIERAEKLWDAVMEGGR